MGGKLGLTLEERFWAKVSRGQDDECWLWTAALNKSGYGIFGARREHGRNFLAHRLSYMLLVGPIPDGLTIDHLCYVPACVNPDHLEPVTLSENARRQTARYHANSAKTHCKKGHEYSEDNTYWLTRKNGVRGRTCRKCNNIAGQAYYLRQKALHPTPL